MQEDHENRRASENDEPAVDDRVDEDQAEEADESSKPHGKGGDPDARNVGG